MTVLLVIAGVWLAAALAAALVIGAAMRRADQGEQRRLARERQLDLDRDAQRTGPDIDDRRTA
ncbi:hypothetical protein KUM42_12245 [Modestobacter sp. L9-4]|uniref:hypothetical protein n=1 Tax=Modestobacter sp. L9-4 TaxID=2851567 RepID=UPI001C751091|nr:hypothetical protein [Modestobacter sp. L9-4]QXG74654.1 hypothetical protein KUM42_12245 [Modestobacter sp. L9-4]